MIGISSSWVKVSLLVKEMDRGKENRIGQIQMVQNILGAVAVMGIDIHNRYLLDRGMHLQCVNGTHHHTVEDAESARCGIRQEPHATCMMTRRTDNAKGIAILFLYDTVDGVNHRTCSSECCVQRSFGE